MRKTTLLALTLLATSTAAVAQVPPGAGQLQQIPPAPSQPRSLPDIRIDRSQATTAPAIGGTRVLVRSLHVTGETRFSEAELIAASGFQPGAEMDLDGLRTLAMRISHFYNAHGYFVAQAYIPAQDIAEGSVTIAVIEGRYGQITLQNESLVHDGLARGILSGLKPGDLVTAAPLQRRLLLLSDLPGVGVKSTLSPGQAVGSSDLLVDLRPGRRVTGSLEADNAGNRYTGEYRGGASVNFNEPLGIGDVLSLRALTSGRGLTYLRGAYQAQWDNLTLGAAYSHLDYRLGREFAPLHGHGSADIASLYGSYPLIRSYDANLHATLQFDARRYRDRVDITAAASDRGAEVVIAGLAGDSHDHLWGGGWNTYSVDASFGDLDIRTPVVRTLDAATARTQGSYGKVAFDFARLQSTGGPVSIYGNLRGQLASKNLDSSEKMELGGAYGVRAYPEGEAYGDQGYIATLEARIRLARLSQMTGGSLQAFAFADHGQVTINHSAWAPGLNDRSLSAAGLGLSWADAHGLFVKVSYAFKLGDEDALSAPGRSGRVWVQISKFF